MIVQRRNDHDQHRCPEQVDHILYVVLMGLVAMVLVVGPLDVHDPDLMNTVKAVGPADDRPITNGEGSLD